MEKKLKLLEDIKQFFGDFELNLNDLQNPSVAFVREFLSRVLFEFNADLDNIKRQQMFGQDGVNSDEVEIIPEINFLSVVQYVCGRFEIGLLDILEPDSKRTIEIFSNIMNFLNFADDRTSKLNPLLDELNNAKENLTQMVERNDELLEIVNALALENDSVFQKIKNLEEEIKNNTKKLLDAEKESDSLKEKNLPIKKELGNLNTENLAALSELEALNEEIRNLEKQIVRDPESEEGYLNRVKESIATVKEKKDEVWKKRQQQTDIINAYTGFLKGIENSSADLDALKCLEEIKNYKIKIAEMEEGINIMERNEQASGSNNLNIETLSNSYEVLINDLNKKLLEKKRIYDAKTEELKSAKNKSGDYLKEINKLNEEIEKIKEEKRHWKRDFDETIHQLYKCRIQFDENSF